MWPGNTRLAPMAICAGLLLVGAGALSSQAQGARVSGRLTASDGRTLLSGAVTIVAVDDRLEPFSPSEVRIFPDGQFTFSGVTPGTYQIRARGQTQANGPAFFATFRLDVAGRDISNLAMTLQPGAVLTGHVDLEAPRASKSGNPLPSITVRAPFLDGDYGDAVTGRVGRDGSFTIRGLSIGAHHVTIDGLSDEWRIKRVILHGRDVTDQAFDIDSDQPVRDVRVTLTQEFSVLDGRVVGANREPIPGARVILFSSAPQFWVAGGRRVRVIHTEADGSFTVRGLPAGAYLAVALASRDDRTTMKPRDLERLRSIATGFTLESDRSTQRMELGLARDPSAPDR